MQKHISLYFTHGTSDKEYHVQLDNKGEGYLVNFQYGKRGGTLKAGTKTKEPISLDKAQKVYDKLVQSKISKGYSEAESGTVFQGLGNREFSGLVPQLLLELKSEMALTQYMNDDAFYAQEKHDGERRMVKKDTQETVGINKKGLKINLTAEIANSLEEKCVIDGEQVAQHLHVFDIRSYKDVNLQSQPYHERLSLLEELNLGDNISITYTAKTKEEKQSLLEQLQARNAEGIVFKHKDHQYKEGRPSSGGDVFKYKFYKTATVRVAKHNDTKRSIHMEMLDGGDVIAVGKVSIPVNKDLPPVGAFIEVKYLYAYKGGSLFQPVYLQERSHEVNEEDIQLSQLVYKAN